MKLYRTILIIIGEISFFVIIALADGYKMVIHQARNVDCYQIEAIDSMTIRNDSIRIYEMERYYPISTIDSITFSDNIIDDTIRIHWNGNEAWYTNPIAEHIEISNCSGHVRIDIHNDRMVFISLDGISNDGSLSIDGGSIITIISYGLQLNNNTGDAIHVKTNGLTTFQCKGQTVLSDGFFRDKNDGLQSKSCFFVDGNLSLLGSDTLIVFGNYKHAVNSDKGKIESNCQLRIGHAIGDGLRAEKGILVEGGSVFVDSICGNGLNAVNGNIEMLDGLVDIKLVNPDTKGIKSKSLYFQIGGTLQLHLMADQCKGVKSPNGIAVTGGKIIGDATGGVVINDGDPSYNTFLKSEKDITINNSTISFLHSGLGGKCISSDGNFVFKNSTLDAQITGDGAEYKNELGEKDYFTPKVVESGDSLLILSGNVNILTTGLGGKGLVSDNQLTIGEFNGNNDVLHLTVCTEGSSIVNDTILDIRDGCPKAIKSKEHLDVLSGNIYIATRGMGGEGLESKNDLYIVGGNLLCNTFDDGINGEKAIYVLGGNIYVCSQNNDGFDSNGSITIHGGNIYSISLQPYNESFDTEGNTFSIYGGTILGLGGSGVIPNQSYIPFYSYPKYDNGIVQKPMPNVSLPKGDYFAIMNDDNVLIAGKIPENMDMAIVTVSDAQMTTNKTYSVCVTDSIHNPNKELFDRHFVIGGTAHDYEKRIEFNPSFYY